MHYTCTCPFGNQSGSCSYNNARFYFVSATQNLLDVLLQYCVSKINETRIILYIYIYIYIYSIYYYILFYIIYPDVWALSLNFKNTNYGIYLGIFLTSLLIYPIFLMIGITPTYYTFDCFEGIHICYTPPCTQQRQGITNTYNVYRKKNKLQQKRTPNKPYTQIIPKPHYNLKHKKN